MMIVKMYTESKASHIFATLQEFSASQGEVLTVESVSSIDSPTTLKGYELLLGIYSGGENGKCIEVQGSVVRWLLSELCAKLMH